MKKILVFHPTIGSYRIDLLNTLAEKFKVSIYLEYLGSNFEIFDSTEFNKALSVTPHLLNKTFKLGSRQLYSGYWEAISTENPDIILVSEFGFDAIASILYRLLHRKKYKIVSICDDSFHMLSTNWDFSRFHKITRKTITPLIDSLILVEPDSCSWYNRNYGKGYCFPIISDEIRLRNNYSKAIPLSKEYVDKYQLRGKRTIAYIGRLIQIKNVNLLIEAYKKLSFPDSKLVIIGDGSNSEDLKKLAADNQNIIFTGRLTGEKLYAWYNIIDLFVLPSIIEPFGAVTNEALAAGCKVLISNNAGSRCLVKDGINGTTFNPTDLNDLSYKLKDLYDKIKVPATDNIILRPSCMIENFQVSVEGLIDFLENL